MPCHNVSHTHNWPRSGSLSIAKCESKCGFCESTKDYKPASALRKHVLTHIKNDAMPLTLEKSIGGRPRLQTVSSVPTRPDQPELPPAGSEDPMATKLGLGNSGADDVTVRFNDNSPPPPDDLLGLESDLDLKSRLDCIREALQIGQEAVDYLNTYGQKRFPHLESSTFIHGLPHRYQKCFLEGTDGPEKSLKMTYPYYLGNNEVPGLDYRNRSLWVNIEAGYLVSLLALHDVEQAMLSPYTSAAILYFFYGMMFLLLIRRLLYDGESRRGVLGPEGERDRFSRTECTHPLYRPVMSVLASSNKDLYALFDDAHRMIAHADGEGRMVKEDESPRYWDRLSTEYSVPKFGPGHTLVKQLSGLIDQLESKWGLAGTAGKE